MRNGKSDVDSAESQNLSMHGNSNRENRETSISSAPCQQHAVDRPGNVTDGNFGMHGMEESDGSVVPTKSMNNEAPLVSAESMEERLPIKRNIDEANLDRAQNRTPRSRGIGGVREAAQADKTLRFNNLLHHITVEVLHESFLELSRAAASGVDKVTWHEYERNVEERLVDLHDRIHRGAYRAQPSKRVWIPKADGRLRPIGIAALEDKIVQSAVRWVLQAVYEADFQDMSYGFRPGRNAHQALDALSFTLLKQRMNWLLDADIEGFFDNIDHEWLMKFLEHRIADKRILRLIRKWLKAGVSEQGEWTETKVGTPQGSVISPFLANVYLHYVFDLWIQQWSRQHGRGEVRAIRYADDFVICFEDRASAERCHAALRARLAKFGLRLHPEKTRLLEFGRFAIERRQRRHDGPPETFDFLGFTHRCGTTRAGYFTVIRTTISSRMRKTLQRIQIELAKRRHEPLGEVGRWLGQVVRGWLGYHAVPGNSKRLRQFVDELTKYWLHQLRRRSQRGRSAWPWSRMHRIAHQYLPRPRIQHAYPVDRYLARLAIRAV
jgi:RNA-directed DNA polymerase